MAKKRRSSSKSAACVGKGGKRVPRKKTGRKGCPKGSHPVRRRRRK